MPLTHIANYLCLQLPPAFMPEVVQLLLAYIQVGFPLYALWLNCDYSWPSWSGSSFSAGC